jgi:hypothetical protein
MTAARTIAIAYFDNNTGHADLDPLRKDLTYDPFVVYQPRPWLLREGWLRPRTERSPRRSGNSTRK